jgi:hypothetical protein
MGFKWSEVQILSPRPGNAGGGGNMSHPSFFDRIAQGSGKAAV